MIEMFLKSFVVIFSYAIICIIIMLFILGISYIIKFFIEKHYDREVNRYLDKYGDDILKEYEDIKKVKTNSGEDVLDKALELNNIRRL